MFSRRRTRVINTGRFGTGADVVGMTDSRVGVGDGRGAGGDRNDGGSSRSGGRCKIWRIRGVRTRELARIRSRRSGRWSRGDGRKRGG